MGRFVGGRVAAALSVSLILCGLVAPPAAATGIETTLFTWEGHPDSARYEGWWSNVATVEPWVNPESTHSWIELSYTGDALRWGSFRAPSGQVLAVGTYAGAVPEPTGSTPGMRLIGRSDMCASPGTFTVHEIAWEASKLTRLAISWEVTCSDAAEGFVSRTYQGEIRLHSTVPVRAIRLTPHGQTFGDRIAGTVSDAATLTIENPGSLGLPIESVTLGGDDPDQFILEQNTCHGVTLAPATSCTFDVRFAPTRGGAPTAWLVITDGTVVGQHRSHVLGYARDATKTLQVPTDVGPSAWWDPGLLAGMTAPPEQIFLHNQGNTRIEIASVTIEPAEPEDFQLLADDCSGASIAPGDGCTLKIGFTPQDEGRRSAVMRIASDADGAPHQVSLLGFGSPRQPDTAWVGRTRVGPRYTWNTGGALARSVDAVDDRLQLAFVTPFMGGHWASDSGMHLAVAAIRRATNGTTWSVPVRLNPANQHGDRVTLTAAGSQVHVAWVTIGSLSRYSPTAPRVLYVRSSARHGASGTWRPMIRLSPLKGRVDFPTSCATGTTALITWTDGITGSIRVARTTNGGESWASTTIGSTTLSSSGVVVVRQSTDGGSSWGATQTLTGPSATRAMRRVGTVPDRGRSRLLRGERIVSVVEPAATGLPWIAATADSLVVAWPVGDRLRVRTFRDGTWHGARDAVVSHESPGRVYAIGVAALAGGTVGIVYSAHPEGLKSSWLWFVESTDGGSHWFAPQALTAGSSSTPLNEYASLVLVSDRRRFVVWNAWRSGSTTYILSGLEGKGLP